MRTRVPRRGSVSISPSDSSSSIASSTGATLTWKLTYSRLSGNALAAHIHMGKPGVAGPVIVPLCGPCKNGQAGKVHISKGVVRALEGGKAYINVHTKKNAAGEIRGQAKVAE